MTDGLMFLYVWASLGVSAFSRSDCLCFEGCCEEGWFQYQDACYQPSSTKMTWEEAEDKCKSLSKDSHLASVHSDEENNYIYHLMGKLKYSKNNEAYWLGGRRDRKKNPHEFTWTDGSKWEYAKLAKNEPDGSPQESFVGSFEEHIDGSITWNGYTDSSTFSYICKKPLR
ncbi:snaclec rhodocytin subunit alpha-like [Rhinatrema bivittatum]|uniref:snaclec rhodocytin subunit alpha-like n=1 Tax=Rhinatrema bivittatum TaxID=194408 RepID=UPI00112E6D91|nr:snaclec rhodocytin subunit alpha-like [Rhinatrema bivittatum]